MLDINTKNIYVLGDTHDISIIGKVLRHYDLKDCITISVGDNGIGFSSLAKDKRTLKILNDSFVARNIRFYAISGNHDDPKYFIENSPLNFSNIELVPDYTYKIINGKKFLFVGGATSIDRMERTPTVSWWEDEVFKLPDNLDSLDSCDSSNICDVLILHSAPFGAYPYVLPSDIINYWGKNDITLIDDLKKEREDIEKLVRHVQPKVLCNGHMHVSHTEYINYPDIDLRIFHKTLDINEVWELKS